MEWANTWNMKVNPTKCGYLAFNFDSRTTINPLSCPLNIPVLNSYKYLGLKLDASLNPMHHVCSLERKINYILNQMYGVLKRHNTRLSLNLYLMLLCPLYRLGIVYYKNISLAAKEELERHMRKTLKRCMCLPINTANATMDSVFLDIPAYNAYISAKIELKSNECDDIKEILDSIKAGGL